MKINRDYLKRIISEEVSAVMGQQPSATAAPAATITPEKKERIRLFSKSVKAVFGDKSKANSLPPDFINDALNDQNFKDLTLDEKGAALASAYGRVSQWPDSVRSITRGMGMNLNSPMIRAVALAKEKAIASLEKKSGVYSALKDLDKGKQMFRDTGEDSETVKRAFGTPPAPSK